MAAIVPPNTSRQESHEKKDVSKLTGILSEIAKTLRPSLPFKIILTRITDKEPSTQNTLKKIHLIRHGQGFHNVAQTEWRAAKKAGEPYWISTDPEFRYLDPELTSIGIKQATELQEETSQLSPDLIIVSPMRRAIQTALLAFNSHINDSLSSSSSLKIIANENAHEIAGKHTCDKRLSKTELSTLYPNIDFSLIENENDPFWGDGLTREDHSSVSKRGSELLDFIRQRNEKNIVIAAHSTILFSLMNAVVHMEGDSMENISYDISWFGTGEMRSFYIQWEPQDMTPFIDGSGADDNNENKTTTEANQGNGDHHKKQKF